MLTVKNMSRVGISVLIHCKKLLDWIKCLLFCFYKEQRFFDCLWNLREERLNAILRNMQFVTPVSSKINLPITDSIFNGLCSRHIADIIFFLWRTLLIRNGVFSDFLYFQKCLCYIYFFYNCLPHMIFNLYPTTTNSFIEMGWVLLEIMEFLDEKYDFSSDFRYK